MSIFGGHTLQDLADLWRDQPMFTCEVRTGPIGETRTDGPPVEPEPERTVSDEQPPQWRQIRAGNLVIAQGWECPRCKVIHAPFVHMCNCQPSPYQWFRPPNTQAFTSELG